MIAIQLFDTLQVWISGVFVIVALVIVVGAFAQRQFGAAFVAIAAAAAIGMFVFVPSLLQNASEKVCEETSEDITLGDFNCDVSSPGGAGGPVVIVDGEG